VGWGLRFVTKYKHREGMRLLNDTYDTLKRRESRSPGWTVYSLGQSVFAQSLLPKSDTAAPRSCFPFHIAPSPGSSLHSYDSGPYEFAEPDGISRRRLIERLSRLIIFRPRRVAKRRDEPVEMRSLPGVFARNSVWKTTCAWKQSRSSRESRQSCGTPPKAYGI
jgi:hypothetical protein